MFVGLGGDLVEDTVGEDSESGGGRFVGFVLGGDDDTQNGFEYLAGG